MKEIGWFYLTKIENGVKVEKIYDLTDEMDMDSEVVFLTNVESKRLNMGIYAAGFYLNEYYEESDKIEDFLIDMCNEYELMLDEENQEFELLIGEEKVIIRILKDLVEN